MQQDVRRSDTSDATAREPEPEEKVGFARGLFRFGSKRNKPAPSVEPARLQNRLKEVLERDRALIASQPPAPVDTDEAVEVGDEDEVWPEPFAHGDPEQQTGTRATVRARNPLAEPEQDQVQPGSDAHRVLELAGERESADLTFSQIASWIEEEISELPEPSIGPVSLDAPLDEHEAAELDAVLAAPHDEPEEPTPTVEAPLTAREQDDTVLSALDPSVFEAPKSETKLKPVSSPLAARPVAKAKPQAARPAPEPDAEAPTREPIRTLTMARLLAMQGYKSRALVVYRELMERNPEDEALRAEYEKLLAS